MTASATSSSGACPRHGLLAPPVPFLLSGAGSGGLPAPSTDLAKIGELCQMFWDADLAQTWPFLLIAKYPWHSAGDVVSSHCWGKILGVGRKLKPVERGKQARVILVTAVALLTPACFGPSPELPPRPPVLDNPGILVGAGFLEKHLFLSINPKSAESRLKSILAGQQITDIHVAPPDASSPWKIVVATGYGAVFLDIEGNPVESVAFEQPSPTPVDIVDIEQDGAPEFLKTGLWTADLALLNRKGAVQWKYRHGMGINDASAGDLDADGTAEIVVGFNGGGGVRLLNSAGEFLWRKDGGGNIWHTEIADLDNDGRGEIYHSNASGRLVVRSFRGTLLTSHKFSFYFSDFSLVRWKEDTTPLHLLAAEDDTLYVLASRGKIVAEYPAPHSGTLGHARGTSLQAGHGDSVFAAVVDLGPHWDRTILYVHDYDGNLLYQEVLKGHCQSLAPRPTAFGDSLLVGCKGQVWEYSITSPAN